jgi:hypothetical protein
MKGRLRLKSIEACEREDWSLLSWPADVTFDPATGEIHNPTGAEPVRRRFLCGSWRCRRCARWRGALDWARCASAVRTRGWWLYIVLTFDPKAYWSVWEAYREAGSNWNNHLREAIRHRAGKFQYLQTWEQHRSGWPHANVILSGEQLRDWVESLGVVDGETEAAGGRARRTRFPVGFRDWLVEAAKRAGFGGVVWAEIIETANPDSVAGYLTKLARELTGAPGGAKGEQSPTMAPRKFRRIRASRGLLPKPLATSASSRKFTGTLSQTRTGDAPAARRTTRQRRELVRANWSEVVAALEALNKPEPRTSNVQGEASASLDEAFRALADFIENDEQLRQDETMPEVPSDVLSSGDRSAPPRLWRADEF